MGDEKKGLKIGDKWRLEICRDRLRLKKMRLEIERLEIDKDEIKRWDYGLGGMD